MVRKILYYFDEARGILIWQPRSEDAGESSKLDATPHVRGYGDRRTTGPTRRRRPPKARKALSPPRDHVGAPLTSAQASDLLSRHVGHRHSGLHPTGLAFLQSASGLRSYERPSDCIRPKQEKNRRKSLALSFGWRRPLKFVVSAIAAF